MADKRRIPKQPKKAVKVRTRGERRLRLAAWLLGLTVFFAAAAFGVKLLYENRLIEMKKSQSLPEVVDVSDSGDAGAFEIHSINVEGNEHYSEEQIRRASGLYIGQSSWKINKAQAVANVKAACPYVESASVAVSVFKDVTITVKETSIVGAMYYNGKWWLVGEDGRAVDSLEVNSDVPPRYLYFKGAVATGKGLGKQAMDDTCTEIVKKYLASAKEHEITGICELDLSNRSDLKLNWNNQITILLGNDSDLDYQLAVIKETLPKVLKNHGQQTRGTLDVSSYSNESASSKRVIFTPEE